MPYPAAMAAAKADGVFSITELPSCRPRWAIGRASSHFSASIRASVDLEQSLDLDCGICRQHRNHQVGCAVHDFGPIEERRIRVDEPAKAHDVRYPVEIAHRRLNLRNETDGTGARRTLPLLNGDAISKLAFGDQLSARIEAK